MYLDVNDEFLGMVEPVARVDFPSPTITVRGLIHARVRLEQERRAQLRAAGPLMAVTAEEQRLNSARRASPLADALLRQDDECPGQGTPLRQAKIAEQAFVQGRYVVLLDDRQAEDLDEVIDLAATTQATFLLLTPLRGG